MADATSMVSVYLECTHWPVVRDSEGRERRAGDHYGDIECPFCDHVLAPEKTTLNVGDKCKRCSGTVVRIEPW